MIDNQSCAAPEFLKQGVGTGFALKVYGLKKLFWLEMICFAELKRKTY